MPRPPALQHHTAHCPQLIDKTCSTVCCTQWHIWAFWQSTLSPSAFVQGLCVVRLLQVVVDTVPSLVSLLDCCSFGNTLLWRFFFFHHAIKIASHRRGIILVNSPSEEIYTSSFRAGNGNFTHGVACANHWAYRCNMALLKTTGLDARKAVSLGLYRLLRVKGLRTDIWKAQHRVLSEFVLSVLTKICRKEKKQPC